MGSPNDEKLSGGAPESAPVALLLIDVINDLEFPGGEKLLEAGLEMAERIAALKARCAEVDIPCIYANDNFGRWQSDFQATLRHCTDEDVRGRPIAQRLRPNARDYFVLKPKQSAFFSTTLATLLEHLGVRTVILTGIAGDMCVLFTAADAHMRDYGVCVPSDCCISETAAANVHALDLMRRVLDADTAPSDRLELSCLIDEDVSAPAERS